MAPADGGTRTKTRMALHLGVIDHPYAFAKPIKAFKFTSTKALSARAALPISTGDVAKILEARYGVMGVFARIHRKEINAAVVNEMEGALESLLMGRRVALNNRDIGKIGTAFRDFISTREAERCGIPGTPTLAAKRGVNHRLAHPYASGNPRRPSFRDTGFYMASFVSWLSTD